MRPKVLEGTQSSADSVYDSAERYVDQAADSESGRRGKCYAISIYFRLVATTREVPGIQEIQPVDGDRAKQTEPRTAPIR